MSKQDEFGGVPSSIKEQLDDFEGFFTNKPKESGNQQEIAFAISLKSKTAATDWNVVQKNLSNTLKSIIRNTDQNYRIIVAGHKKPNINELKHEKVTWLTVKFTPPTNPKGFTRDKMRKRRVIGTYLRKIGFSGYFMPLDADDWIHHRFVEYIRAQPFTPAFILDYGFFSNIRKNEIWLMKEFYKRCGSSAVFYFSSEDFPKDTKDKLTPFRITVKSHPQVQEHLIKINKDYVMVNEPLVLRFFGHSDNNSILKGKLSNEHSATDYNLEGEIFEEWIYNYFKILDQT